MSQIFDISVIYRTVRDTSKYPQHSRGNGYYYFFNDGESCLFGDNFDLIFPLYIRRNQNWYEERKRNLLAIDAHFTYRPEQLLTHEDENTRFLAKLLVKQDNGPPPINEFLENKSLKKYEWAHTQSEVIEIRSLNTHP